MKLFILFAFILPSFAYSAMMNLNDIIKRGIETSETLKNQNEEKNKKRAMYGEYKAKVLPHINADAKWIKNFDQSPALININPNYAYTASVGVTQVLWSFGQVSNAINAAREALDMSEDEYNSSKEDVIYNLKLAYYTLWLSDQSLTIAKESYKNAVENEKILRTKFSMGRPSQSDLIKLKADLESRIPTLKQTEIQYELSLLSLKRLINWDYTQKLNIKLNEIDSIKFKKLDADKYLKKGIEKNHTIKMLQKNVTMNENLVQVSKADFLPTISGFANYNFQNSDQDKILPTSGSKRYGAVGIAINIPIWNGGEKSDKLKQVLSNKIISENTLSEYEKTLKLQILNNISTYNALIDTLDANTKALASSKRSYRMTKDMFNSGKISVSSLNDAELMETKMRNQVAINIFNLLDTKAALDRLISESL